MIRSLLIVSLLAIPQIAVTAFADARLANFEAKNRVSGEYLVLFKSNADLKALPSLDEAAAGAQGLVEPAIRPLSRATAGQLGAAMAQSISAHLGHAWSWKYIGRQGMLITQATDAGMRLLAQDPRVAYIEPNLTLYPQTTQSPAPQQLVRINYRTLPSSAQFDPGNYTYDTTGSGVVIAIPDSGVYMEGAGIPPNFGIASNGASAGGRVSKIVDCVVTSDCSFVVYTAGDTCQDGICPINQTGIPPGEYATGDCSPVHHGSNIAEVAGGAAAGVAKGVTISAAVVTYSCYGGGGAGNTDEMAAAIGYFIDRKEASPGTPFVLNISESPQQIDATIDNSVKNALAAGISVVVAAGDTNGSTCGWSPADLAPTTAVISVSSTYSESDQTMGDATGKCV